MVYAPQSPTSRGVSAKYKKQSPTCSVIPFQDDRYRLCGSEVCDGMAFDQLVPPDHADMRFRRPED